MDVGGLRHAVEQRGSRTGAFDSSVQIQSVSSGGELSCCLILSLKVPSACRCSGWFWQSAELV